MLRRFFQIFCLFAIFSGQAQAAPIPQDIHAAMLRSFQQARYGQTSLEAGFTVSCDGTITDIPSDNQRDALQMHITATTIAVYHVHPNNSIPEPSQNDITIANKYHFLMYTMSRFGVFLYDPSTGKITKVEGNDWFKS